MVAEATKQFKEKPADLKALMAAQREAVDAMTASIENKMKETGKFDATATAQKDDPRDNRWSC